MGLFNSSAPSKIIFEFRKRLSSSSLLENVSNFFAISAFCFHFASQLIISSISFSKCCITSDANSSRLSLITLATYLNLSITLSETCCFSLSTLSLVSLISTKTLLVKSGESLPESCIFLICCLT